MSRRRWIGVSVGILALIALAWVIRARRPVAAPVVPSTPAVVAAPTLNRPTVALAGYATWPVSVQRQALAELERAPVLDSETTRFLLHIVKDPAESANARNLAANALTAPGRWVGGLAAVLIAQARDPAEDPMWRDYALQHAATIAMRGEDTVVVVAALGETATAGGPSAGTALLMLQRIEQAGKAKLDPAMLTAMAAKVFAAPEADINATISVLGVIGERRDPGFIDGVRAMLGAATPAVRRAACGALGRIGTPADAALATTAVADPDASVAAAAAIARDRLSNRQQP